MTVRFMKMELGEIERQYVPRCPECDWSGPAQHDGQEAQVEGARHARVGHGAMVEWGRVR